VSVKLPIGVALRDSFGCAVNPADPNQAWIAAPERCQPPGTFRQACSVPSVLDVEGVTAVITCRALPVVNGSGRRSACDVCARAGV
jgi:hypothetical protein